MAKTSMLAVKNHHKGFTLLELMIAIAILGILLAIAVPQYNKYIRESRRAQAQTEMLQIRQGLERWRANNASYRSDATPNSAGVATTNTLANVGFTDANDFYNYTIDPAANNTYTINAAAQGKQTVDQTGGGVSCANMTLNQNGAKTPLGCWKK